MPTPTEELIATISERLKAAADVKVVYGEPQVIEGKTIIPVAVASYGFGAGSGGGKQGTGGGGGGGGMRVKPVGVVEITAERTRFIPIVDVNRLATLGLIALVVVLFWFRGPFRRR